MARIVDGTEMNMIGDKLRALRTANGWSQQAVSDKLEMLVDKDFWPIPTYGDLLFEV